MSVNIVVEGKTDIELLKAIIGTPKSGVLEWWTRPPGGVSLAQSLLVTRNEPVALIADADVVDPGRLNEQRDLLRELLGRYGRERKDWIVILFVPESEELLFSRPELLAALTNQPLAKVKALLPLAKLAPKKTLAKLTKVSTSDLVAGADLSPLQAHPIMKTLIGFLKDHQVKLKENGSKKVGSVSKVGSMPAKLHHFRAKRASVEAGAHRG